MAVSMNSGFMRSDYMISDAALPLRMEELEIEQLDSEARFSDILGEIGNAPAEKAEITVTEDAGKAPETIAAEVIKAEPENDTPALNDSELKSLARSVVQGKIKLDEIPEEYVTDVLLMVIAMMMLGVSEDEIPVSELTSNGTAEPVQVDIRTAEDILGKVRENNTDITELLQIVSETAGVEIPEDMKQELGREIAKITPAEELSTAQTQVPVVNNVVTADEMAQAEISPTAVEAVTAETAADAPVQEQQNIPAQAAEQAVPAEQTKLTEEFEQLRRLITEYTVKKSEPEQPAQQSYTAQAMGTENTAKSRVVSKSEELELLKTAVKPAEPELNVPVEGKQEAQPQMNNGSHSETENGADTQQLPMEQMPQSMAADIPVVFVRDDGTQVEVRPTEIVKQITESIVEQTTTSDGDTEYSVTLTPEDLGSITVKLTKTVDGAMTVSITAENARTQRLIEQHGAAIQENLKQSGIELENWQTVNQSEQQYRAQDYNGSSGNPYYRDDSEEQNDDDADDTSFAELISAM